MVLDIIIVSGSNGFSAKINVPFLADLKETSPAIKQIVGMEKSRALARLGVS
jgi:hypothetical protein